MLKRLNKYISESGYCSRREADKLIEQQRVTINGRKILICRAGGALYAVENRCTHQEAELEGGRIRGCFISCPLHGVRFDLRDGNPMGQLTREALPTFEVRVIDGMIEVAVS